MATYVDDTRDLKHGADGKRKKPRSQTLEDVAEEMLNGMFCHYEPPDPSRVKRKHRGILRTSSSNVSQRRKKTDSKSVRWVDKTEEHKPPVEIRCNVATNCVDAGIEAGCISPKKKEEATEILSKLDYDLQPTDSMDSRVPYRPSRIHQGLSFDDDGYPMSDHGGYVLPPHRRHHPQVAANSSFLSFAEYRSTAATIMSRWKNLPGVQLRDRPAVLANLSTTMMARTLSWKRTMMRTMTTSSF